jgi:hypothetical protein
MRIDITPYLQRALEDIAQAPVDLSAVHAAIELDFRPDMERNVLLLQPRLEIAPDAAGRFREALASAGLDDLKVFELARAFDRMTRAS